MFTILIAVWVNKKAFDGVHKRLDDILTRLDRIEKLDDHETRIARVDERTSLLRRG
jgi:tetrahydromethanopterin S-methyltransferase subunit G